MTKLELIQALIEKKGLSNVESQKAVGLFFDTMASAIAKGQRVEIGGLCTFKVRDYPGYTGRNPKTGERLIVRAKKLPIFKPGMDLKKRVDR